MKKRNSTNYENLITFADMPPERHRELSARGGVASGISRRKKRDLQIQCAEMLTTSFIVGEVTREFQSDMKEFMRWKKRRDKARKKQGRSTKK